MGVLGMGCSGRIAAGSGHLADLGTQSLSRDTRGETDVLRWRYVVIGKAWLLLIPAVGGLLIAAQWPDIRRYLKIRQLSQGQGHPENVPVGGTSAYPHPGGGKR